MIEAKMSCSSNLRKLEVSDFQSDLSCAYVY